jgi:hypothetical protein
MTSTIDKLIADRDATHGKFSDNARITWSIMRIFMAEPGWERLTDAQRHGLYMAAAHKPARIICGDPNFIDHWVDIAGYATVVVNTLKLDPDDKFQSEAGGHHTGHEEDVLIDGVTYEPPPWRYVEVTYLGTVYYNVDRDFYSAGAIEHLPQLAKQVSTFEFNQMFLRYRGMYLPPIDGHYGLDQRYITNWT